MINNTDSDHTHLSISHRLKTSMLRQRNLKNLKEKPYTGWNHLPNIVAVVVPLATNLKIVQIANHPILIDHFTIASSLSHIAHHVITLLIISRVLHHT